MYLQWKKLAACIALPLAVGFAASTLTGGGMDKFAMLNQPPLSPPGWLFPIVWTILYTLMGIASYLVFTSELPNQTALTAYAIQLALNFVWPILFFNLGLYLFSFVWLVLLWLAILAAILLFLPISRTAARLMLPYLLWVTFAGYLNFAIYLLN